MGHRPLCPRPICLYIQPPRLHTFRDRRHKDRCRQKPRCSTCGDLCRDTEMSPERRSFGSTIISVILHVAEPWSLNSALVSRLARTSGPSGRWRRSGLNWFQHLTNTMARAQSQQPPECVVHSHQRPTSTRTTLDFDLHQAGRRRPRCHWFNWLRP